MKRLSIFCFAALVWAGNGFALLERSTPEAEGIPSAAIDAWITACEKELNAVHGFVLLRHGKTIAEGWWKPFSADRTHILYSHSKSFTSTAIGFLIDDGVLDLDECLVDIFPDRLPENPSENLKRLRVRDLLTMNTGMPATDPQMRTPNADWVNLFLANNVADRPGTCFRYDSCATHMLAAIVEKKSGKKLMDFLKERLFDPIGIEKAWSTTSPTGIACGGWGMSMTTRELARFGQLYLQEGMWDGKQILSREWVRAASSRQTYNGGKIGVKQINDSDWAQGYGFQFWRCRFNCFRADGASGQLTVVMPDQDAVLSVHAGLGPMQHELNLIWKYLLPAFQDKPLPANPEAEKALVDRCAALALKTVEGKKDGRQDIFGKTYTLAGEQAQFHFDTIRLDRKGDGWEMVTSGDTGEQRFPIGYGQWQENTVKLQNTTYEALGGIIGTQSVASSGAWSDPNTFRIHTYLNDGFFRFTMVFTFAEDGSLALTYEVFGWGGKPSKLKGTVVNR
ncbi:MAG: serine hydrolase [Kiritimatiellae bacterium]|nr:serine hydrolase [Kiritimatiellia bacterium]